MSNALANESSPYLLQHAENPVNWHPWGDEALSLAKKENKPIFLSIGYSACHWCHVMAHESFDDPNVAKFLNDNFVSIKVDREERPDIDDIYMNAVIAMNGHGGWPLSLFLTPNGEPFYGGTYFPPNRKYGMPSFLEVLGSIARFWNEKNEIAVQAGQNITRQLKESISKLLNNNPQQFSNETITQSVDTIFATYDWENGGWGGTPKFPHPMVIEFLLSQATRRPAEHKKFIKLVIHLLNKMSSGGFFDILGGGFHRYSTDATWLVPHFEKMLYDNAQLAKVYLHSYLITGVEDYRKTCETTLNFILREMTDPQGGFFCSIDADSDGKEGLFYLWDLDEIQNILNDPLNYELCINAYNLSKKGNFEGKNILQKQVDLDLLASKMGLSSNEVHARMNDCNNLLFRARNGRTRPYTDDKIIVSWNALALQAFSEAGRYLYRKEYLEAAKCNAEFILTNMYSNGHLWHSWRHGITSQLAFLDDYSSLILALISLYQSDFNPHWYNVAVRMAEEMIDAFYEPSTGFYDTQIEHSSTIFRPRQIQDNATPSGSSQAAMALLMLSKYTHSKRWQDIAEITIRSVQNIIVQYPLAHAFWLNSLDFALGPVQQAAIVWKQSEIDNLIPMMARKFIRYINNHYRPRTITAASVSPIPDEAPDLLKIYANQIEQTTAYICEGFVCQQPITSLDEFMNNLDHFNYLGYRDNRD